MIDIVSIILLPFVAGMLLAAIGLLAVTIIGAFRDIRDHGLF